jgi:long-chain acyl-CoA synthetase
VTASTLLERLREIAATDPGKVALRYRGQQLTFPALVQAAELCACQFVALGLERSQTVAVLADNRPEVLVAYYAASRLGAVFVPINPVLSAAEISCVIGHCAASLLIYENDYAEAAHAAMRDSRRCKTFDELAATECLVENTILKEPTATDDFLTIYTSGSTGVPKAVVFDQTAEMRGNAALIELWGVGPSDVIVVGLPLGFLYGLSTAASAGLQGGAEIVLVRKFHPRDVLNALVERHATIYQGVPTMFAMMLNFAESEGIKRDLSGMRLIISAGAPLSEDLRARFARRFNKRIDDYYAMTEARPIFGRRWNDTRLPPKGAVGKLAPGVEVTITSEGNRVLGVREHGEIVVRAPGMFRRYANSPQETENVLGPHGFRTGDVGFADEQGYYYLTGRIKDIIIRGGANIAPAEVEGVLSSHPAVQMAAVVGMPDATFGEVVAAFVVLRNGAAATSQELIDHCMKTLATFKVPAVVRFVATLRLGPTGKIDKTPLKAEAARLST